MLLSKKRHRHEGNVTLTSISNCDITALGDIKVVGKGSVNHRYIVRGKLMWQDTYVVDRLGRKGIDINIAVQKDAQNSTISTRR